MVVRCVPLAVAAGLTALSAAAPAAAHADLVVSFPAQGSVVQGPLSQVRLTFEEPPSSSPLQVVVTGHGGRVIAVGRPRVEGRAVVVAVGPVVEAGRYRVGYRVTAGDGHPETGEIRFTIASGTAGAALDPAIATMAGNDASTSTGLPVPAAGGRLPWIGLALVALGLVVSAPLTRALARRSVVIDHRTRP
jgi:hypothetical protein